MTTSDGLCVAFGRFLLKYAMPVFEDQYLTWSYSSKNYDTLELYEIFKSLNSSADTCTENSYQGLLPSSRRKDILETALAGGSDYWCDAPDTTEYDKYRVQKEDSPAELMLRAISKGESIPVYDLEYPYGCLGELNLESMHKGEHLMKQIHPEHFNNILAENDDAEIADMWFQFCVMGKIVFG